MISDKNLTKEDTKKRVSVFIDASNLWAAQKSKAKLLDYEKITKYIRTRFNTTETKFFYYTAYPANGTRDYDLSGRFKFFVFLEKGLKFLVIKKKLKRINTLTDLGQVIEEKGNMDVEMTIDAVHNIDKYDTVVFFSGDSDFLALVTYLKNNGKKVFIISSKNNISHELKTGANGYTDILNIEEVWGKDLKHRNETEKDHK